MTKRELKKYTVIQDTIKGVYTVPQAAKLLCLSHRQIQRLKKKVILKGPDGVIHQNRGKKSINSLSNETVQKIIDLKHSYKYEKANFTHYTELLAEHEDIHASYSCVYSHLKKNGFRSPRKHRKPKLHHCRKRRDCFGELVQTDGTPFDWFGIGKKYSVHGYIDDATGIPLGLYMCENECLLGYLEITRQMLVNFGIPEAIYSDKFSVFFPPTGAKLTIQEELEGKEAPQTQYCKILHELNIDLIAASSSQAKGRIERLWNTLQDRLFTEFRVHNITSIEDANNFFPKFIKEYSKKFSVRASSPSSKFIKLPKSVNLDDLLVTKFTRVIDNSGCFSFYNKKFQVLTQDIPAKSTVTVLISHKIGVKAEFKDVKYDVLTWDDLPTNNSPKDLSNMFKKINYKNYIFATTMLTVDAKKNAPLLVSS